MKVNTKKAKHSSSENESSSNDGSIDSTDEYKVPVL